MTLIRRSAGRRGGCISHTRRTASHNRAALRRSTVHNFHSCCLVAICTSVVPPRIIDAPWGYALERSIKADFCASHNAIFMYPLSIKQ